MTSTEFNIGLGGGKSSSRVLKPPGGGHSNIFGEAEVKQANPRPKYDQQNSSNLNFCMNTVDPNLKVSSDAPAPATVPSPSVAAPEPPKQAPVVAAPEPSKPAPVAAPEPKKQAPVAAAPEPAPASANGTNAHNLNLLFNIKLLIILKFYWFIIFYYFCYRQSTSSTRRLLIRLVVNDNSTRMVNKVQCKVLLHLVKFLSFNGKLILKKKYLN